MLACILQGRMVFSCILYWEVASADLSLVAASSMTLMQVSEHCSAMRCVCADLLSSFYTQ